MWLDAQANDEVKPYTSSKSTLYIETLYMPETPSRRFALVLRVDIEAMLPGNPAGLSLPLSLSLSLSPLSLSRSLYLRPTGAHAGV